MSIRPGASLSVTIPDGIRAAAQRTPTKTALVEGDRALTYAQLIERIDRVSNLAVYLGLEHGDRAMVLLPNRLEYVELVLGLASAGVSAVTVGPASSAADIAFILDDCGARVLFVAPELVGRVEESGGGGIEKMIIVGPDYEALLAESSAQMCSVPTDAEDIFMITYTSGSTGAPKGVMLSHRARVNSFHAMSSAHGCYSPDDRSLATTPLFHGAGFMMAVAPLFFGGFCEILPRFDIQHLMGSIERVRANCIYMVPSHFSALFSTDSGRRYDTSSLKALISGTAPLAQAMKERIVDYFGPSRLFERYGSTEASIVSTLRPEDQLRKLKCVGQAFPMTQIRVLDSEGNDVPTGTPGELYSSSPLMFSGYWNRPGLAEQSRRGDWITAGDIAMLDEEGYLYLVDRKSDMIISGGENIYPREVEETLLAHPAVAECGVVGLPHDYWGEAVTAYVVLRENANASPDDLLRHAALTLARFKLPKAIHIVGDLPRNSMGKVLRRTLRQGNWPAVR
ncbi:class I adenylate-forming enzyme family protein [Devosia ginsengisoli]|uniref:3-methylmercaptopropionyl-CoA ligase n=1 Tax=Devosia ginsengisoli TaxID=400770 RepID=A0A5B8LUI4_9HYPH|nr:AMP-binding protein [Devosia ginsengisoli]QDZ11967.1 long-chain fatty acid--CoA ligase [Devosia ginsengisoli]